MRADKFFAERFGSRAKAKEALLRGEVLLNGKPLLYKAEVKGDESFVYSEGAAPFVSEGGYKLERGLSVFGEDVSGKVFADLGASTGGFTDCLLRRGAKRVYCVDVGESQLDPKLRSDDRVRVMDGTNARYLTENSFPEGLDGIVSDLSFISLKLVLPAVSGLLSAKSRAFVLFKPQFECGGEGLPKSGILPVRFHSALLSDFYGFCIGHTLAPRDVINAPLREKKNVEYVLCLEKEGRAIPQEEFLFRAQNFFENRPPKT